MSDDWMARPTGRFVMWWLLILIGMGLCLTIAAVSWGVLEGIERLTGNKAIAFVVGVVILITFVAAGNAWLWTHSGPVQALIRVMTRMEGRRP